MTKKLIVLDTETTGLKICNGWYESMDSKLEKK
jgi:hypothetical protein